jgi:hypothetical protein
MFGNSHIIIALYYYYIIYINIFQRNNIKDKSVKIKIKTCDVSAPLRSLDGS